MITRSYVKHDKDEITVDHDNLIRKYLYDNVDRCFRHLLHECC